MILVMRRGSLLSEGTCSLLAIFSAVAFRTDTMTLGTNTAILAHSHAFGL